MAGISRRWAEFSQATKSWKAFARYIETSETRTDSDNNVENLRWSNKDLDPTPPEERTWTWYNYVVFYFGLSFGNWTLGSTFVGLGMNWWQSIVIIFVSSLISSIAMFFNSRSASVYHIGYPCVGRSCFGMWGSYYFVGARAMLAIIWFSVQLMSATYYIEGMFHAIFGHNWTDIPNHIPESIGITTSGMIAFIIAWLIHFSLCWFRPYQLTKFFWFKGIICLPAVIGTFIYCMIATKGNLGPLYSATNNGSNMGWIIIHGINAGLGNSATLITNQPDLARWSKTRTGAMWSQILTNPFVTTLSAVFGILATSAINNAWGLELWNQWDLYTAILDRHWTGSVRFAIVLVNFCWLMSIIGTNVAANMIPFGSDSSMLLPRYITIPRGQFIVTVLGLAICPWKILASAATFTNFLSGYGLFMASVVAIMIADYYLLTNGNVFVRYLYDGTRSNPHYRYKGGWNLQAVFAYIVGVALPFPGFIGTLGPHVSAPATHLGQLGWCLSFITTFIVYYVTCLIFPTENQRKIKEMGLKWEEMGNEVDGLDESVEGKAVMEDQNSVASGVEVGEKKAGSLAQKNAITVTEL